MLNIRHSVRGRNPAAPIVTKANVAENLKFLGSGESRNDPPEAEDSIGVVYVTPETQN